jgi:hypothetical protein
MIDKKCIILKFCLAILIITPINLIDTLGQDLIRLQIKDSKSKSGIPYAYIKVIGKNILRISNVDGYFSLPISKGDSLELTHVSYKKKLVPYSKVKSLAFIEMEELPIETNPIIISARDAEIAVKRAIDSTHKELKLPLYFNDTLVREADVELFYDVRILSSASNGGLIRSYIRNIIVKRNTNFKDTIFPVFPIGPTFAPINMFVAKVSKNNVKDIYFSYQNADDSIIIVSFKPKYSFVPNDTRLLKEGRFIINRKTWKFIRIEATLNPEMLSIGRLNLSKKNGPQNYLYQYYHSQFFDYKGFPTKMIFESRLSILEDNPDKIWRIYCELVLEKENDNSLVPINKTYIKKDTSFVMMKSSHDYDFEKTFLNRIPKDNNINVEH